MEMDRNVLMKVKDNYDMFSRVNWKIYLQLEKFLEYKVYPKNSIIKHFDEVETHSRLLVEGIATLHHRNNNGESMTRMVFCEMENPFDFLSYTSGKPSPSMFMARTEVKCLELRKDIEPLVLREIPEIVELAININHGIISKLYHWNTEILSQSKQDAYRAILNLDPKLEDVIHLKDIQQMLGVGKSTIHRIKNKSK